MRRLMICLAFQGLTTMVTAPVRAEQSEIVWFRSDYAPGSIVSGPEKDKGYLDVLMSTLKLAMPQYRHTWVTAPMLRREEEIRNRSNACSPGFLKTPERERIFPFTTAMFQLLPPGLTISRAAVDRFKPYIDANGRLHLGDVLAKENLLISVAAGRSYGPGIDQVIKSPANANKIVNTPAADLFSTAIKKLADRHDVDGVLGYAVELSYAVRQGGFDAEKYYFLPTVEETRIITSYIICSPTDEGRAIIQAIDAVYAKPEVKAAVRATYRSWLPPEAATYFDQSVAAIPSP